MGIDFIIVLIYFTVIMITAVSGRKKEEVTIDEYFLSNRNLKWYSIAISTIATNIQGYQFLGMMGSAYLYGLAQASLEINAVQGLFFAAFVFVPLYLREKITTITQFVEKKLGKTVAYFYSGANLLMFATLGLGAALFWGAYAADLVFADYLSFISEDRLFRIAVLVVFLGVFSAIYTVFGGLAAVVRTDIIQFSILTLGGIVVLFTAIHHLGGWEVLYEKPNLLKWGNEYREVDNLMHLHLPADHPKLPWIHMFGLFFLNINYWCANQSVMQRSLAASSLKQAQVGLMVGGLMKYFMAILIVIPGIALAGILMDAAPLAEPDQAFPYLVKEYLPVGARGLILCALFASLMSTVDSTFNSFATLWSVDFYKGLINKNATDKQVVNVGRLAIIFSLITGITMGLVLLYIKFNNPESAFTHTLNELRYYINCGIVMLICTSAFFIAPNRKLVVFAFLASIPLQLIFKGFDFDFISYIGLFPNMNYFVRAGWIIVIGLLIIGIPSIVKNGLKPFKEYFVFADKQMMSVGLGLLASLVALHIIFH